MLSKECTKCKTVKPAECFSKNSSSKTGLHSACKECDKKRQVKRYKTMKRHKTMKPNVTPPNKQEITRRAKEIQQAIIKSTQLKFQPVGNKFDPCIYCGRASDGWDHVPSREYASRVPEAQRFLYPACGECNSSLSSRPLFSLKERLEFLHERYKKIYDNIISMPEWTQDEINELKGTLKKDIETKMKNKHQINQILRNLSRKK